MNIIFSRKGFDLGNGRMASPILTDGSLLSAPILSDSASASRLDSLCLNGHNDSSQILSDLSGGRISGSTTVHMDPDLCRGTRPRLPGWLPAFGQVGSAQSHLRNKGVGLGDVFLFYGWFRNCEQINGSWEFRHGAPDIHVIFGWLQVGSIIHAGANPIGTIDTQYPWLKDHPHVRDDGYQPNNTIYVASECLSFGGQIIPEVLGGGIFSHYTSALQLTAHSTPDTRYSRSEWCVPSFFFKNGGSKLTYHSRVLPRFIDDRAYFNIVARGQEFVYACDENESDVIEWTKNLIVNAT